jgi:hypothetical protein
VWGVGGGGGEIASVVAEPSDPAETGPEWEAASTSRVENPAWFDWKVLRAAGGRSTSRVEIATVRCGGENAFFLFGLAALADCEIRGMVTREVQR